MEIRKFSLFILLFLLLITFSFADETMNLEDIAEKLTQGVDNLNDAVDFETGDVNINELNKLLGFEGSRLEKEINNINEWLDSNLFWLKFIFRIRPQISWLFVFNLFFILFFLTHFVLNSKKIWSIFTEEDSHQLIIGISVFLIFLVTNIYLSLSKLSLFLINVIWSTFINISLWLAIFLVSAFVVGVCIFGLPAILDLLTLLFKLFKALGNHSKNKTDDTLKELKEKIEETDAFMAGMKGKNNFS